ncbi:hypothetical protein MMC25_007314 [Agyrium rufum]|nr:hypothetical protein [Agyrium rufum]
MGFEYRKSSEDLYELTFVRDEKYRLFQGAFYNFPDLVEWPSKDLYQRHPSEPNLWRYRGRGDDVIVFVTGEKLNPVTMEGHIESHAKINSALVFGQARFQTGLLLETTESPTNEEERKALIEDIWPTVQKANKDCPAHGRLAKHMIIFADPWKLFLRAGKGTVQRNRTLKLYAHEIDAAYQTLKEDSQSETDASTSGLGFQAIKELLQKVVLEKTSLGQLNDFLREHDKKSDQIEEKQVYANQTIDKLDKYLSQSSGAKTNELSELSNEEQIQYYFDKYTSDLPIMARMPVHDHTPLRVVILTGSTGSLGSYILDTLIKDHTVAKIYCFNRGADSQKRQSRAHESKGLTSDWAKVRFLEADLSKPYFGLDLEVYQKLLTDVTHIIHNGWKVDFKLSLEHFTGTHIHGVR